jgi:hypothetical protein
MQLALHEVEFCEKTLSLGQLFTFHDPVSEDVAITNQRVAG